MVTRTATEQGRRTADLPPELFIHWIHAREEDQDDIQFFRTEGFSFPPSFGRDGMEIRPDGTFIQDDVGPADGIVQTPGRWTLEGPGRIAVRFDGAREDYAFTLVSVSAELLQIRQASSATSYPSVPCADAEQMERFTSAPPAAGFRLLDFDYADVVTWRASRRSSSCASPARNPWPTCRCSSSRSSSCSSPSTGASRSSDRFPAASDCPRWRRTR
jgi:hypothetical protein